MRKSVLLKKILCLSVVLSLILMCFTGCKESNSVPDDAQAPVVTLTMEDGSVLRMELYYDAAPQSVCNFIYLVSSGFYDGMIFHRVIKDFVIQAGDASQIGLESPNYTIKGEFSQNGFENSLSHERGVVSMARATDMDSASTQFFICCSDVTYLDGQYAAFGKLIDDESYETLDILSEAETDVNDKPVSDLVIKTAEVDTFGVEYPLPEVASGSLS